MMSSKEKPLSFSGLFDLSGIKDKTRGQPAPRPSEAALPGHSHGRPARTFVA